MRTLAIVLSLVLISSITILPYADAQQSTRRLLVELNQEGRSYCQVWQINDFIYKPVRVNIVHEPADQTVNIQSDDPESKVYWDGGKESFQLVTSSTDRHRIDFELDYNIPTDEPRNVFYQVFAKDRTLMMDGSWQHLGDKFCIIIEFFTQEAPEEITEEEIIEINNAYNAEQARINLLKFTTIETALLILLIVISVVGIMTTLYFIIILIHNRSMKRVANRPVAKLEEMVTKIRKLAEVFKLLMEYTKSENKDFREIIMNKIDDSLFQLTIVKAGEERKRTVSEAIPSPESLVLPSSPKEAKKEPEKIEPNTDKQEKENEESQLEQYGIKPEETSVSFADIVPEEKPEEKPEPEPKPEPKPKQPKEVPDENTIEIDPDKVKPCHCGKEATYICKDCGNYFCDDHEEHTCKEKIKIGKSISDATKSSLGKISKLIVEKDKPSILDSDDMISELLHKGVPKKEVVEMIVKEYMKIPFEEARVLHEKLNEEYRKDMTYPKSLRLEASMTRIMRSDK